MDASEDFCSSSEVKMRSMSTLPTRAGRSGKAAAAASTPTAMPRATVASVWGEVRMSLFLCLG